MNKEKNSSSKNFYLIIRKKVNILNAKVDVFLNEESKAYEYLNECYFKVKETLTRCGNVVDEVYSKQNIIDIFHSFL